MRKRILTCIATCLYYSGGVALARWWMQRRKPCVIVLNYHCASGGYLREHVLYLQRHYRIMPLEAALETYALSSPTSDHRPPLVMTFDDGYHDNYTHAFALAREFEIPVTLFLIPEYIEHGNRFWWQAGKYLVKHALVDKAILGDTVYRLDTPKERKELARAIDSHLRRASSVAEREEFLLAIHEALGVSPELTPEEYATRPLSWSEVCEMQESGLVSFGAHTMNHPILSCLTDSEELQREVEQCRVVLEQRLNQPVRSFAYPVGQQQHIGDQVIATVRQAGYNWAFTTNTGFITQQSNLYALSRIETDVDQHWLVVAAEAAGLWGWIARLRWIPWIRARLTT